MNKAIYLDHAAATPVDRRVLKAMRPYLSDRYFNPSALYLSGKTVRKEIEAARSLVARTLGVRPGEITFTSGGTESNNLAISGVMRLYPDANVIVSAVEHDSVLSPARQYQHKEAPVEPDGRVNLPALQGLIDDKTVLVSVMYANNEIGTIQPIAEIARIIKTIRHERMLQGNQLPLYLHTDACQAANYLHLFANKLGADMMTLNGGKIYGPKQSGVLYASGNIRLQPQNLGGGQESGRRSGTENVAGIIGFATALELAQNSRNDEAARLQALQDYAFNLVASLIPSARINGSLRRIPNNMHITFPGQDNERLIMALDEQGIMAAAGSACSASSSEPSHVLRAIGLSDKEARCSLRFTMGRASRKKDLSRTIEVLAKLVA